MAVATATALPFIDITTKNPAKMLNPLFRKLPKSTFLKIVEEKFAFYNFIISLYLPIDKNALLNFYKSYDDMVIAINSNTGS